MSSQVTDLLRDAWDLRESEQWDKMLALATEARQLSETQGFALGRPRALAVEAFVHYIRSDFKTALAECIEALRLGAGDIETEARARGVLALVHWSLGNYEEALRNSDRSIQLLERTSEEVPKAFAYAVKGGILLSLGELDEALEWHQRSLDHFQTTPGEISGKARALSGLGLTYLAQKRYEKALASLLEALAMARRVDNRVTTARALNDVGEAFEALGDDEQALKFHSEALEIRQQDQYRQSETTSLIAMARLASRRAEYAPAIEMLERALSMSEELGLKPRIAQSHHALADIYQKTGQLAPALQHVLAWERAKSELAVDEASLRYRALALENQLEDVQRHAELESLASLGSLVAAIVHEINSPLGAIQSSANVAALAADKLRSGHDEKAVAALQLNAKVIADGTSRISELVSRLKIFAGVDQARYAKMNLVSAARDSVALIHPEVDDRVKITIHSDGEPVIYAYPTELHQTFFNLLRNGVQAIEGAGSVQIGISADDEWFRVSFKDSGRGIPPETLRNLFTPTFSSGSGRVRASLSLFTCMAVVKKHRGDIHVETEPGKGSTFTVLLPRSLERTDAELEAAAS